MPNRVNRFVAAVLAMLLALMAAVSSAYATSGTNRRAKPVQAGPRLGGGRYPRAVHRATFRRRVRGIFCAGRPPRLAVRLKVQIENLLPEDTTVHWQGIRLPDPMGGVPTGCLYLICARCEAARESFWL